MPFRKTKFYAIIELPRPINCLITFASVLLGGWLGIHDDHRTPDFCRAIRRSHHRRGQRAQ